MKAWQVHELGEPRDVLRLDETTMPTVGPGDVLVRVRAAAANFPDSLLCQGTYQVKPDLPFTPGLEVCGEVAAVGDQVCTWSVGDRVIGAPTLPHGGFAEYAVLNGGAALVAPEALDDAEASALLIGYQTGWFALRHRAGLKPGETLLVHAAAGGVGSAAVQLGKAMGARVIGVAGGADKANHVRQLGADIVIDRRRENFVAVVNEATQGMGADVIYDPVGGDTYDRSVKCIAFEGRILLIGFAGGRIQAPALNHALIKNYSIVGVHWGLYAVKNPELVRTCHEDLVRLAAQGKIRPFISERLPLERVGEGVQRLADGKTVGRLVFLP
ncbi:MAG: NADPH:quinone oxidoreductase family protein [Nostocoides sp.]